MSRTIVHLSLDIQGFLMNHTRKSDYARMFKHDDGRPMSATEAKTELLNQLSMGRKLLPCGKCDGFSYETGCPGHVVDDSEIA